MRRLLCAIALALLALPGIASAQTPASELERFAQDPSFLSVTLSPSGRYIAGIRRDGEHDRILIVDWRAGQAYALQTVARDAGVEFNSIVWKTDDRLVFSATYDVTFQARAGTGSRLASHASIEGKTERVFAIDRTGANMVRMFETQMERVAVRFAPMIMVDRLANDPEHILLATFSPTGLALWRGDVATGQVEKLEQGNWNSRSWFTDGTGAPVLRLDRIPFNSGYRIFRRSEGDWRLAIEVRRSNATESPDFNPIAPGPGAGQVYVIARPEGRDLAALYLYDAASGAYGEPVFSDDQADVHDAWTDPRTRSLIAACSYRQMLTCRADAPDVRRHLNAINSFFQRQASVSLVAAADDGATWLLHVTGPRAAPAYFIYDRANVNIQPVAPIYTGFEEAALAPTEIVTYRTRDGQTLWGYLTARADATGPRPLVVVPHGGPEARDYYRFDWLVQFLASRGYGVFQPQFRGSEGMGQAFSRAGYRQWGRIMQHDISDGVAHLVATGAADGRRVCIVGGSYGGYAALAGATLTPELYRCAASIAGVSDLGEFLRWARMEEGRGSLAYSYWTQVIGDPQANRDDIAAYSPARQAARASAPILLMHGNDDDIVPIEQSEIMRDALQAAGKPARYVPVEDEGHSPSLWSNENRLLLLRELDAFLAEHLAPAQ